jgi:hypothetical protein
MEKGRLLSIVPSDQAPIPVRGPLAVGRNLPSVDDTRDAGNVLKKRVAEEI